MSAPHPTTTITLANGRQLSYREHADGTTTFWEGDAVSGDSSDTAIARPGDHALTRFLATLASLPPASSASASAASASAASASAASAGQAAPPAPNRRRSPEQAARAVERRDARANRRRIVESASRACRGSVAPADVAAARALVFAGTHFRYPLGTAGAVAPVGAHATDVVLSPATLPVAITAGLPALPPRAIALAESHNLNPYLLLTLHELGSDAPPTTRVSRLHVTARGREYFSRLTPLLGACDPLLQDAVVVLLGSEDLSTAGYFTALLALRNELAPLSAADVLNGRAGRSTSLLVALPQAAHLRADLPPNASDRSPSATNRRASAPRRLFDRLLDPQR